MENFFGTGAFSDLSVLAALTTVIVQLIKGFIPKKVPTQVVTMVVGILLSVFYIIATAGFGIVNLIKSLLMGCVTAFVAMNGFDALRDIWTRFTVNDIEGD